MKKFYFIFLFGTLLLQTVNSRTIQVPQDCSEYGGGSTNIIDGHEYVDLGLPSGTLWATCNVGANSPEEYGGYFAWGETTPKSNYDWSTYKYGTGMHQLTKYCNNTSYGLNHFKDTLTVLEPMDDAATANWGNGWRMPTLDEIRELFGKCSGIWTTQNGVNGRLFTGPNGNTLFLPAAGTYMGTSLLSAGISSNYWSSTLDVSTPDGVISYGFGSGGVHWTDDSRSFGLPVRPIVK